MKKQAVIILVSVFGFLVPGGVRAAEEDSAKALLTAYESVRAALAADDLAAAQKAAGVLASKATAAKQEAVAKSAGELAKSADVEKARASFKAISDKVIPLAKGKEGYFVIYCPMAKASWVQTKKEVENPYYGKSMLKCGEVISPRSDAGKKGGCCS